MRTVCFLFCMASFGATYYVSPAGLDVADGLTVETAWGSLQHAADNVMPGDSVMVMDGDYDNVLIERGGTAENPVTFRAWGDDVWIHGGTRRDRIEVFLADYVIIDGFKTLGAPRAGISVLGYADDEVVGVTIRNCTCTENRRWGIFTGYARDVTIENNECSFSFEEHGIYVSNSANGPIIRGNVCFNNHASGIQINGDPALEGDGIINHAKVIGNVCYRNGTGGGAAFNFASIRFSEIYNNLAYDNAAGGMAFWDDAFGNSMGCKSNKIFHNTIVMPADGRWAINMINDSTNNQIYNNILLHAGNRGGLEIDSSSLEGLQSNCNILKKISVDEVWIDLPQWQQQYGHDGFSFSAQETDLFRESEDFHLRGNSPANGKGLAFSLVTSDFEGDARPSNFDGVDIGADEFCIGPHHPQTFYLAHVGRNNYVSHVQVLNPHEKACRYRLVLHNEEGTEMISREIRQNGMSASNLDLRTYSTEAFSGHIEVLDGDATFKEMFSNSSGGMAEFVLVSKLSQRLLFAFPTFSDSLTWKGIACTNFAASPVDLTIQAVRNGRVAGELNRSLSPREKLIELVGTEGGIFADLNLNEIDLITIHANEEALAGINISGLGQERLLFTQGVEWVSVMQKFQP